MPRCGCGSLAMYAREPKDPAANPIVNLEHDFLFGK
jgi:hypothetical protein